MRLGRDWPAWAARLRTALRDPVPFFSSAERGSEVLRGEVSWLSRYIILKTRRTSGVNFIEGSSF